MKELEKTEIDSATVDINANDDALVYESIRSILENARNRAATAVNHEMVIAYWEVGHRIHDAMGNRAEYGKHLIEYLSNQLTREFGKAYSQRMLWQMRQFYLAFPIVNALRSQLSWTHYRTLTRIKDSKKREFYEHAAAKEHWSSRKLEQEIHSFCYERTIAASRNTLASLECNPKPRMASFPVKDPYVLDFLGLPEPTRLHESELEQALIDHMQEFLLELGTGFAFLGRQVRVSSELSDYYVDLVFYHTRLKCHVLIDLKAGKLNPRDVGQMDFYVRLFDDLVAAQDDNPTVGIVLCAEGDRAVAKYSALSDGRGLFAARYVTVLPTEEELANAIERALC